MGPPPASSTTTTTITPITTLCRHYALRGKCRFGNRCNYSHELPHDCTSWEGACSRIPCPHYKIGLCRYGPMCRLAHVIIDDPPEEEEEDAGNGNNKGSSGKEEDADRRGDDNGDTATKNSTTSNDVAVRHQPTDTTTRHRGVVGAEGDDDEEELVCGICLDPLGCSFAPVKGETAATTTASSSSTDKSVQRKKFGLLTGCDHVFCIDCLRHWRKEQKKDAADLSSLIPGGRTDPASSSNSSDRVRACPECRQVSDFVVPSDKFCVGYEKAAVVSAYTARLSVIPCKRFNGRLGSCPFGQDCFYAHKRSGRNVKSKDKSRKELWEAKQRRNQNRHADFLASLYWLDEEWNTIPAAMGVDLPPGMLPDPTFSLASSGGGGQQSSRRRGGGGGGRSNNINTNTRRLNRGSRRPERTVEQLELQEMIEEHMLSVELLRHAIMLEGAASDDNSTSS